jgi:hypothetical protein
VTGGDRDLVIVLETGNRSRLDFATGLLEDAGIPYLREDAAGSPILGAALFPLPIERGRAPCRLRVSPQDVARAEAVLETLPPEDELEP